MIIDFEVTQQAGKRISEKQWENWFKKVEKKIKNKQRVALSVAVIGDRAMRNLNNSYRKKNKTTDVLSFATSDTDLPRNIKAKMLGEIFISYPQAARQAKKFGHATLKEVEFLLVHGFLHLLGYDHQTDRQENEMDELQYQITGLKRVVK